MRRTWLLPCCLLVVANGCGNSNSGSVSSSPSGDHDELGQGGAAGSSSSEAPAGGATSACNDGAQPSPAGLRRLTNLELDRTLAALVGAEGSVSADHGLPTDPTVEGFVNNRTALSVSPLHARGYFDAAETLATRIIESPELRQRVVGCDLAGAERQSCLPQFITRFGRLAFRRALEPEERAELEQLAEVAADDPNPWMSAGVVIQAVLQAPSFLYRVELGTPDPARPGWRRLSGEELATRLAFTLWQTAPEPELLDAAERGELDDPAALAERARVMLSDARAEDGMRIFYEQWLRLSHLESLRLDPATYPEWNEELRRSMLEETRRVVDDHVWSGDLLGVLTSSYTYVDSQLAGLYGIAPPGQDGFIRVELPDASSRRGILTHASILALSGRAEGKAPILRGKYVRDVFVCNAPPAPPDNVPQLPPARAGVSERERLAEHRANPACQGCHSLMDPVGFGFERYDLLGRYREVDESGAPLSGEGELTGFDEPSFVGAPELAQRLADASETERCIAKHAVRYTFGAREGRAQACTVERAAAAFAATGGDLRELWIRLAEDEAFRYVQGEAP